MCRVYTFVHQAQHEELIKAFLTEMKQKQTKKKKFYMIKIDEEEEEEEDQQQQQN